VTYRRPTTIQEAVQLLKDNGPTARVLAGGTDIIVMARERRRDTSMFVDIKAIPETQALTALDALPRGQQVNVEPSLTLSDRLNGHLLLGHVDGVGTVVHRRQRQGELVLDIRLPAPLGAFVVSKGPIAVDGVSLTVGALRRAAAFAVHLIPETLRQTTLGSRDVGDRVNLEVDYLAKLVWHFTTRYNRASGVTRRKRHPEVDWGEPVGQEAW
jgi:riboflavin synthase